MKRLLWLALPVLAVTAFVLPSTAQEHPKDHPKGGDHPKDHPKGHDDEKGQEHPGGHLKPQPPSSELANFDGAVGEWKVVMTMPKGPMNPEGGTAEGTYTVRKGLGGHAFISDYKTNSKAMGEFEGHEVLSYDTTAKQWKCWWFDTHGPGQVWVFTGQCKDGTLTLSATDEMMGKKITTRITYHFVDKDKIEWKMDSKPEGGEEWSNFASSVYTRTK